MEVSQRELEEMRQARRDRDQARLAGQIDLLREIVRSGRDPATHLQILERVWQDLYYHPYIKTP